MSLPPNPPLPPALTLTSAAPSWSLDALSQRLFAGECLAFTHPASLPVLADHARSLLAQHLPAPLEAETLTPEDFRKASAAARKLVAADEGMDRLWRAVLAQIGFDPAQLLLDRLRLRVVPSDPALRTRFYRPLPPHRDSWGSGIMAQINWWMPLFPLNDGATMVLWPDLFDKPVANTSADWSYQALMSRQDRTYPILPEATAVPASPALPLLAEPGTLVAFSAAHLHASRSEPGAGIRLSLDTRTIWQGDLDAARGAPNVDAPGARENWEMFGRPARPARP